MSGFTGCKTNQSEPSGEDSSWFEEARWSYRLLLVSGPEGPLQRQQLDQLKAHTSGIVERDLLVIDITDSKSEVVIGNKKPAPPPSSFQARFDLPSEAFQVTLIGKDGGIKERRKEHFDTIEIFQIIDAMPMRMREMREK